MRKILLCSCIVQLVLQLLLVADETF